MDPYSLHLILVVGEENGVGDMARELRASLARRQYSVTSDATRDLEGVRAVICYPSYGSWRAMLRIVRKNMALHSPRQMAFVGFNIGERWILWSLFLKMGMTVKPSWLRFFPASGSWFHSLDERKIDIVEFVRRKPNHNGAHARSEGVSS